MIPESLANALGGAELRGAEWYALCPAHEDTNPSLAITEKDGKLVFVCRAGCTQAVVLAALKERGLWGANSAAPRPADRVKRRGGTSGTIIATYDYLDAAGKLVGQVCRFEPKGFRQRRPNGKGGWIWNMKGVELPLYRLPELLAADPAKSVIIVEGEKDVESLRSLGFIATTNPGGAGKWTEAWTQTMEARDVVLVGDADEPGRRHTQIVAAACFGHARRIRCCECSPPHKDVSDWIAAGASKQGIEGLIRRAKLWAPSDPGASALDSPDDVQPEPAPGDDSEFSLDMALFDDSEPAPQKPFKPDTFRPLGHDHGALYYYSYLTRQVVTCTSPADAEAKMLLLAPSHWWEANFNNLDAIGRRSAKAYIVACAIGAGVYDPQLVRGRGGWFDKARIVIHCGSHLLVDGVQHELADFDSRHTYEAAMPYPVTPGNPLSNTEAHRLIELCERLNWQRPANAALLAGWIAIAPFCGALDWRPHISINGESGSGKSWIVDNIILPLLADVAMQAVGNTTEAGIRQQLGHDARPVVFDEFEPKSKLAQLRIAGILDLMRAASSNRAAPITKGTAGGHSMQFFCRSMFCFSGIVLAASDLADMNRLTILSVLAKLDGPEKIEHFASLETATAALLTPEWIIRFRSLIAGLLPTIRANARTFTTAWTAGAGNRRAGDQTGALLAGAYALHSTGKITPAQATDYIRRHDWTEERAIAAERDPTRLLNAILSHLTRVQYGAFHGTLSIGELIELAADDTVLRNSDHPSWADAKAELQRHGIRVRDDHVQVATSPAILAPILGQTGWATGHSRILRLLEGAESPATPARFETGVTSKITSIPMKSFMNEESEAE